MKKTTLILIGICIFATAFVLLKKTKKPKPTHAYSIGILQTASHPALDAAQEGFTKELKQLLADRVEFTIKNAQGSIPHAHTIAQQFQTSSQFDAFFAIATPAAQALGSVEKERPIIIAAVTDPARLGLLHATTNICGIKDMVDPKALVELIYALTPNVKTVGLIYTTGEINAVTAAELLKLELKKTGLETIDFGITQELELPGLIESACRKVDALLAPNDNIIAGSISLISSIAQKYKKPLFVCDPLLVASGPLAARGIDYKSSGAEAARMAHKVLVDRIKPYDLPIEQTPSNAIVVNKQTLTLLGLTIPDSLKDMITLV